MHCTFFAHYFLPSHSSTFFSEFSPLQGHSCLRLFHSASTISLVCCLSPSAQLYYFSQFFILFFPSFLLVFIGSVQSCTGQPPLHWDLATSCMWPGWDGCSSWMHPAPQKPHLSLCTVWPFPELLHTLGAGQLSLPPPPSLSPPLHQPVTWQFPFLSPCKSFLQFLPSFLHWVLYFSVFLILILQADSAFPPWILLIYDILVKKFWWYYFL